MWNGEDEDSIWMYHDLNEIKERNYNKNIPLSRIRNNSIVPFCLTVTVT